MIKKWYHKQSEAVKSAWIHVFGFAFVIYSVLAILIMVGAIGNKWEFKDFKDFDTFIKMHWGKFITTLTAMISSILILFFRTKNIIQNPKKHFEKLTQKKDKLLQQKNLTSNHKKVKKVESKMLKIKSKIEKQV